MKKRYVSLFILSIMLQQFLPTYAITKSTGKSDMNMIQYVDIEKHWAKEYVNNLSKDGIVKGTMGDKGAMFVYPEKPISKAELLALVVRAFGLKVNKDKVKSFRDVKEKDWYKETVDIAYSNRIFDGFADGTVRPNELVTKGYVANVIARVKGWKWQHSSKTKQLKDVSEEQWYYESAMALLERGIVQGNTEGRFQGGNLITRAEAMAMIQKVRTYKASSTFDKNVGTSEKIPSRSLESGEREGSQAIFSRTTNTPAPAPKFTPTSSESKGKGLQTTSPKPTQPTPSVTPKTHLVGTLTPSTTPKITPTTSPKATPSVSPKAQMKGSTTSSTTPKVTPTPSPKATPSVSPKAQMTESTTPSTTPEVTTTLSPKPTPSPTPTLIVVPALIYMQNPSNSAGMIFVQSDSIRLKGRVEGRDSVKVTYRAEQDDGSGKIRGIRGETDIPLTAVEKQEYKASGEFDIPAIVLQPDLNLIYLSLLDGEGKKVSKTLKVMREKDADNDGLLDYYERKNKTSLTNPDTDGDGLTDGEEVNMYGSDPLQKDTDHDGLRDDFEAKNLQFLMDPIDPNTVSKELKDGDADSDGDWLSNLSEQKLGTDPLDPDTDGDGIPDGTEVQEYATNPVKKDSDGDGISDWFQIAKKIQDTTEQEKVEDTIIASMYSGFVQEPKALEAEDAIKILDIWRMRGARNFGQALLKLPSLKTLNVKSKTDASMIAMIRFFQSINGLKVTGKLDLETTDVLLQPEKWKKVEGFDKSTLIVRESFGSDSYIKIEEKRDGFKPKYYSQNRGEWSTYPYYPRKRKIPQNGRVITRNGCGPSAMAMILATVKDPSVTPKTMAEFSMEADTITESYDTMGDLFPKAAKAYGIGCKWVGSIQEVTSALETGKYIAIASMGFGHFTGGGHLIALMGVEKVYGEEDRRILVYDSNSGNDSYFRYGKDGKIVLTNKMGQVLAVPDIFDDEKVLGYWLFDKK